MIAGTFFAVLAASGYAAAIAAFNLAGTRVSVEALIGCAFTYAATRFVVRAWKHFWAAETRVDHISVDTEQ
jgi:hypothetical protein